MPAQAGSEKLHPLHAASSVWRMEKLGKGVQYDLDHSFNTSGVVGAWTAYFLHPGRPRAYSARGGAGCSVAADDQGPAIVALRQSVGGPPAAALNSCLSSHRLLQANLPRRITWLPDRTRRPRGRVCRSRLRARRQRPNPPPGWMASGGSPASCWSFQEPTY